ncbi:hypothetical protein GQ457_11G022990 [Hibiscus cannabinus]
MDGYYNAGDNVKLGFPMAFTTTILALSVIEFKDLMLPNELRNALVAIHWATDYLLKIVSQPNQIFVQLLTTTTIINPFLFNLVYFTINSIDDVSWLLRVSTSADDRDDEYLGLPPIAANDLILCLIWEHIAILYTDSLDDRSDATASLVSLARHNDWNEKLIIEEEEEVGSLLKLVKEGKMEEHNKYAIASNKALRLAKPMPLFPVTGEKSMARALAGKDGEGTKKNRKMEGK